MSQEIENLDPNAVWSALLSEETSILVDVRTRAEWSFVGLVDLSEMGKEAILIEWAAYPQMNHNDNFAPSLLARIEDQDPEAIYFLCRSGVRSVAAARMMQDIFSQQGKAIRCVNVAEGFEGDLDSKAQRGNTNGWKHRGLAWRQS